MQLTTSTAASVLGVPRKSLDNILVAHARHFPVRGKQGRSRRISYRLLERIAVALVLSRDLRAPFGPSLAIADAIIQGDGEHTPGSFTSVQVDLSALRATLSRAITTALEETSRPRRGRPPRNRENERGAFE